MADGYGWSFGLAARVKAIVVSSACIGLSLLSGACATVRPEQRAVLADPMMQFDADESERAARQHVIENREGSFGGGSVRGGGCGCN